MKQKRSVCSIILSAGKGTRIGLTKTHKTCLPVGGKPVLVGSIEAYKTAGISPHVVVVGTGAQHVLKTVGGAFPDVFFAYQPRPLGTGNAAKCGARLLNSMGFNGDVLVTAGDKLVEAKVIRKMIREFRSSGLDCLFLVGRKEDSPGSGRVILDEKGCPVGVIEVADIKRARALSQILEKVGSGGITPEFVAQAIATEGTIPEKSRLAFGPLYDFSTRTISMTNAELMDAIPKDKISFRVPSGKRTKKISAEEAASADHVNLSLYLVKAGALEFALRKVKADNAQGEEYLTDIVEILAAAKKGDRRKFKLGTLCVDDPHQVMGFNNLEELRAVEEYVREKEGWI